MPPHLFSFLGPHARRRDVHSDVHTHLKKHECKGNVKRRAALAKKAESTKVDFYKQQDFPPRSPDEKLFLYIARMNSAIAKLISSDNNNLRITVRASRQSRCAWYSRVVTVCSIVTVTSKMDFVSCFFNEKKSQSKLAATGNRTREGTILGWCVWWVPAPDHCLWCHSGVA